MNQHEAGVAVWIDALPLGVDRNQNPAYEYRKQKTA